MVFKDPLRIFFEDHESFIRDTFLECFSGCFGGSFQGSLLVFLVCSSCPPLIALLSIQFCARMSQNNWISWDLGFFFDQPLSILRCLDSKVSKVDETNLEILLYRTNINFFKSAPVLLVLHVF
jgi:hypothetical protein